MGVQGTQNGGIDGAPLTATVPGGIRELMAENLLAVWLDLECASGNDARSTESEIRVGAKILPYLIGGSDLICSASGQSSNTTIRSIPRSSTARNSRTTSSSSAISKPTVD